LVQLAQRFDFPPVLMAQMILEQRGIPRKQFWKYMANPATAPQPRHPLHELPRVVHLHDIGVLVDVDPVALTAADLRGKGVVSMEVAAGGYLLGTLANLILKGMMVLIAGGRALGRHVLPGFLAMGALTALLLFLP